jgi:hypothetical protein
MRSPSTRTPLHATSGITVNMATTIRTLTTSKKSQSRMNLMNVNKHLTNSHFRVL